MKRRDLFLALPTTVIVAAAQTQSAPKKPPSATKKKPAPAPKKFLVAGADEKRKDRHLLAMMMLLMYRKDVSTSVVYPNIDIVKTKSQDQAAMSVQAFGKVDPGVYTTVQGYLNKIVGNPSPAIKLHQQAARSIAADAVGAEFYPDNECPFWDSITAAVATLLA